MTLDGEVGVTGDAVSRAGTVMEGVGVCTEAGVVTADTGAYVGAGAGTGAET